MKVSAKDVEMKMPLFKFPTEVSKLWEIKKYEIWNSPKIKKRTQYIKKVDSLLCKYLYKKNGDISKEIGPVRIAKKSNIP